MNRRNEFCLFLDWSAVPGISIGCAPSPRFFEGFSATPDGMLYVFGGMLDERNPYSTDPFLIYRYDPAINTWTRYDSSGPNPAQYGSLFSGWDTGFAATSKGLYVFSGFNSKIFFFSPENNTWTMPLTSGVAPPSKTGMGLTSTPDGKLYVFGGSNLAANKMMNDLHSFSPESDTWTNIAHDSAPPPRIWMGCTATPDGMVYIFGGMSSWPAKENWIDGQPATIFNDLHRFDPVQKVWTVPTTSGTVPSPRYDLGIAATPDGMIYIFGGNNVFDMGALNDLYRFDTATSTWTPMAVSADTGSPGRMQFGMTATRDGILYMFGGRTALNKKLADLYSYNTRTYDWIKFDSANQSCQTYPSPDPGSGNTPLPSDSSLVSTVGCPPTQ